jgi:hypothetical protein
VHENEVMRAYKTVHVLIEPVSFIVPRRVSSRFDKLADRSPDRFKTIFILML